MKPDPMYPLIAEVANLCNQLLDLPVDGVVSSQGDKYELYALILSDAYELENTRLKLVNLLEASYESKHYKLSSEHATGVRELLVVSEARLCFIDNSKTQHIKLDAKRLGAGQRLTAYLQEQGREDLCWIVVTILANEDVNVRQVYGSRIMKAMNGDLKVAGLLDRIIPC